jgi:hypothetical protein
MAARSGYRYSVIIPTTRSSEAYLDDALDSVLRQTARSRTEILVCVNGDLCYYEELRARLSAEGSPYAAVRVLHEPRMGVSYARDAGIEQARGTWIVFLDDDDMLSKGALAELDKVAPRFRKTVDVVLMNNLVRAGGKTSIQQRAVRKQPDTPATGADPAGFLEFFGSVCYRALRRDAFSKGVFRKFEEASMVEDTVFWMHNIGRVGRIAAADFRVKEGYVMRRRRGSVSRPGAEDADARADALLRYLADTAPLFDFGSRFLLREGGAPTLEEQWATVMLRTIFSAARKRYRKLDAPGRGKVGAYCADACPFQRLVVGFNGGPEQYVLSFSELSGGGIVRAAQLKREMDLGGVLLVNISAAAGAEAPEIRDCVAPVKRIPADGAPADAFLEDLPNYGAPKAIYSNGDGAHSHARAGMAKARYPDSRWILDLSAAFDDAAHRGDAYIEAADALLFESGDARDAVAARCPELGAPIREKAVILPLPSRRDALARYVAGGGEGA